MTRFLIARHGETGWNAEGRFQGHADIPLNERGREQARALADRLATLAPFDAIVASDLARAFETASIVGRRLGLPVEPEPGLREIDVGHWSGLVREEIEERWPGALARWAAGEDAHGGESRADLARRVEQAALAVASRFPGRNVLLVAHGGVIRSLQRIVEGAPAPVLENCAVWAFSAGGGRLLAAEAVAPPQPLPNADESSVPVV